MVKILGKYAHQSYAVMALCVGIIAGVIVGLVARVDYFVSGWWVVLAVVLLVLAYFNPKVGFVGVALMAGVVLALVRVAGELGGQEYVRQFYGKEVVIQGTVEGDPNVDETEMKVKLGRLEFGEERRAVDGSIYMTVRGGVEMRRADEVTVKGKLSEGFGTYVGYMYKPEVKAVRRPEPGDLVLVVRDWFAGRVREMMPEPLIEKIGAYNNESSGTVYLNGATTMKAFGKTREAMPYYEKARQIYEKTLPENDFKIAAYYNNVSSAYKELGETENTEKSCFRALEILSKCEGYLGEAAVTHVNLAHLYYDSDPCDERVYSHMETAWELLMSKENTHDGNFAFLCSKCYPSFGFFGYFEYEKTLKDLTEKIYEGN